VGSAREGRDANDTFAKLLRAHAAERGHRPAFRHKDFGIWQTWTWAEVFEQTRAIAQGLLSLGLDRGDTIAVAGANRPRLYWSMTAAQMIGAVPVPVYADSVADEIAAVLGHSEAAVIVAQDQEQVDKILSVRDRLPRLRHLLYDEPRGLTDYDEPSLHALEAYSPGSPSPSIPSGAIPAGRDIRGRRMETRHVSSLRLRGRGRRQRRGVVERLLLLHTKRRHVSRGRTGP